MVIHATRMTIIFRDTFLPCNVINMIHGPRLRPDRSGTPDRRHMAYARSVVRDPSEARETRGHVSSPPKVIVWTEDLELASEDPARTESGHSRFYL